MNEIDTNIETSLKLYYYQHTVIFSVRSIFNYDAKAIQIL